MMTTYTSLGYEIAKTHKALRARLQAALAPRNVTVQQYEVLRTLHAAPGITAAQLVEEIISDSSTMMAILKRLELKGLILRTADETDRRTKRIHLTDEGRTLAQALAVLAEEHNRRLQACCSPRELQVVTRVLSKLCHLTQPDPGPAEESARGVAPREEKDA